MGIVSSRAWRVQACKESNNGTLDQITVVNMYPMVINIKTVRGWNFRPDSGLLVALVSKKMEAAAMYKNSRPNAATAVPRLGEITTKQRSKNLKSKFKSVKCLFLNLSRIFILS